MEDTVVASIKFKNGALGSIECTTAAFPGTAKKIEIIGSKGSAILEENSLTLWEFEGDSTDSQVQQAEAAVSGGVSDPMAIGHYGHQLQLEDFLAAIQGKHSPLIDGQEGKKSVALISAIYESAKTGQTVLLIKQLEIHMSTEKHIDLNVLLSAMKADQVMAFDQLYFHFAPILYQRIFRLLKSPENVEEVLQEVFLKIWNMRDQLEADKGFTTLLFRMCDNLAIDHFRKSCREKSMQDELWASSISYYMHTEEAIFSKEKLQILDETIQGLSQSEKKSFYFVISRTKATKKWPVNWESLFPRSATNWLAP